MKTFSLVVLLSFLSVSAIADPVYLNISQRASEVDVGLSDQHLMQRALKTALKNAVEECVEDFKGVAAATACITSLSADAIASSYKAKASHVRKAVAKVKLYCRAERDNVSRVESYLFARDGSNFSHCTQRVSVQKILND